METKNKKWKVIPIKLNLENNKKWKTSNYEIIELNWKKNIVNKKTWDVINFWFE